MQIKEPKAKSCKVCKAKFTPRASTQVVCSWQCASAYTAKEKAKRERKEYREKKEQLKTRREWIIDAQTAFNAYIRERDKNQPCICCGQPLVQGSIGGGYDCGHYRSTGSAPHLRFNEDNAHGQRKVCNRYGAGRAVDYRIGLVKRIGIERVGKLESDNEPKKWTIDELKELKQKYKDKLKELKCEKK